MTSVNDTLQEAIINGEVLTVIYQGGSQPGKPRQLAPIQLLPGNRLRARCIATNTAKIFMVSKIQLLESGAAIPATYSTTQPAELTSINEAMVGPLAEVLEALRQNGWCVESAEDRVSVHRVRKNGRPLVASVLSLDHRPFHMGMDWSDEADDLVEIPVESRERPWVVSADKISAVTFRSLNKAITRFLLVAAQLLAPNESA